MTIKTKFSIAIMDTDKISEINQTILKYCENVTKSSSHLIFNTKPIYLSDIVEDLTYFHLISENESDLDKKLNDLINELNEIDTDYSLRNEESGGFIVHVECVGAVDIKFDNIESIPKGTYEKIDDLKYTKTDFRYCKGYKPTFRPLESTSLKNKEIIPETIYVFANTPENMSKLRDQLSKKIMEIDSDFIIEHRKFV